MLLLIIEATDLCYCVLMFLAVGQSQTRGNLSSSSVVVVSRTATAHTARVTVERYQPIQSAEGEGNAQTPPATMIEEVEEEDEEEEIDIGAHTSLTGAGNMVLPGSKGGASTTPNNSNSHVSNGGLGASSHHGYGTQPGLRTRLDAATHVAVTGFTHLKETANMLPLPTIPALKAQYFPLVSG